MLQGGDDDQSVRSSDEQDVIRGLKTYTSLGSFRGISKSPHHFFLDTAHNALSLPVALDWFNEEALALDQRSVTMTACQSLSSPLTDIQICFPWFQGIHIQPRSQVGGQRELQACLGQLEKGAPRSSLDHHITSWPC